MEEVIIAEDCGSEEVLLLHERPVKMEPPVKVPIPDHKMMETPGNRTSTSAA